MAVVEQEEAYKVRRQKKMNIMQIVDLIPIHYIIIFFIIMIGLSYWLYGTPNPAHI